MADEMTCAVCGEAVTDTGLLSECRSCGSLFHLNPRADIEGIDCGDVWTGDAEAPALQFHCQPCIDRSRAAAPTQAAPAEAPPTPPGIPPLPPGAPPEMLAAMAGWPTPVDPGAPPAAADAPPPVRPRPQRRRRFRRIDVD